MRGVQEAVRHAWRTDSNQKEIIKFLTATGHRHRVMKPPCPWDLTVWRVGGRGFVLFETKTEDGRPTKNQLDFEKDSKGLPFFYIRTPEEAYEYMKRYG